MDYILLLHNYMDAGHLNSVLMLAQQAFNSLSHLLHQKKKSKYPTKHGQKPQLLGIEKESLLILSVRKLQIKATM